VKTSPWLRAEVGYLWQAIRASDVGFIRQVSRRLKPWRKVRLSLLIENPPAALGSNHATLRNTDNRFWTVRDGLIIWARIKSRFPVTSVI
jgi:hypothetical protein